MKDPILNNINENRAAYDSDAPAPMVWDKIEKELHPKKKKRIPTWFWKVAVVLILGGGVFIVVNENLNVKKSDALASAPKPSENDAYYSVGTKYPNTISNTEQENLGNIASEVDYEFEYKNSEVDGRLYVEIPGSVSVLNFSASTYDISYLSNTNVPVNSLNKDIKFQGSFNGSISTGNGVMDGYHKTYNENKDLLMEGEFKNGRLFNGKHNLYDDYGILVEVVTYKEGKGSNEIDPATYYEQYAVFNENKFENVMDEPLSTFSIDVDAAGYSNMRRFISKGYLPPKNAVRLEEMVNYFKYDLPEPAGETPFSISTEVGVCPWHPRHELLQVAIKGKSIAEQNLPASNLVFLLDVSGSMNDANKLPLLKKGLSMLVNNLRKKDKIAIVVYAGAAGVILPPTTGDKKELILSALNNLNAGGSTAGGEGIELAYKLAEQHLLSDGNNRIILATDGDFNVGVSSNDELVKLIEKKRKTGVFLSVLGFGEGNLQDEKMEQIADNGNGNYAYIDNVLEAKKVLVTEMGGTMHTIAKDVKLQLEFNPNNVESYRLLGYENRMLETKDFEDDTKDAGELGSGHTVVALYEVIPSKSKVQQNQNLKYQSSLINEAANLKNELVTIKFRYKEPKGSKSKLLESVVRYPITRKNSNNFLFASAVAEFGLLIRESEHRGMANFESILARARHSKGIDENGYRAEFIKLVEQAEIIQNAYFLSRQED